MVRIGKELFDRVSAEAAVAPRRRKNHNFHKDYGDPVQRMLNAIEPWSYIRPHKHEDPDKREIFFSLRGRIVVVEFAEDGTVTDHFLLDPLVQNFGTEIPERVYHTLIALDPETVSYEVKDGPFSPIDDKNFAPWAPREGDPAVRSFMEGILERVGLRCDVP